MIDIKEIADKAELIVNGYAYTKEKNNIRVLNLNRIDKASVINENGEVIETTMDDIEIDIILDYLERNKEFMGVSFSAKVL